MSPFLKLYRSLSKKEQTVLHLLEKSRWLAKQRGDQRSREEIESGLPTASKGIVLRYLKQVHVPAAFSSEVLNLTQRIGRARLSILFSREIRNDLSLDGWRGRMEKRLIH